MWASPFQNLKLHTAPLRPWWLYKRDDNVVVVVYKHDVISGLRTTSSYRNLNEIEVKLL